MQKLCQKLIILISLRLYLSIKIILLRPVPQANELEIDRVRTLILPFNLSVLFSCILFLLGVIKWATSSFVFPNYYTHNTLRFIEFNWICRNYVHISEIFKGCNLRKNLWNEKTFSILEANLMKELPMMNTWRTHTYFWK